MAARPSHPSEWCKKGCVHIVPFPFPTWSNTVFAYASAGVGDQLRIPSDTVWGGQAWILSDTEWGIWGDHLWIPSGAVWGPHPDFLQSQNITTALAPNQTPTIPFP
jgi:hypothetical protein